MYNQIIKTKFIPPNYHKNMWEIPGLYEKYSLIEDYPLTVIEAGPGYGKSTTIYSYFYQYYQKQFYWYTVDELDVDTTMFFMNFIYAFSTGNRSNIGCEALKLFKQDSKTTKMLYKTIDILINDLVDKLDEQSFLIIDDFHLVAANPKVRHFLEYFINLIPPGVHLIILNRGKVRFNDWSSWRLKKKAYLIGESNFILNKKEIKEFFAAQYDIYLKDKQYTRILDMTEGWLIALDLIGQSLKNGTRFERVLSVPGNSLKLLFDYLASEVLEKQSAEVREFLLKTSILMHLRVNICNILLNIDNSKEILQELVIRDIFVDKIDNNEYRYHHLFHQFLKRRSKDRYDCRLLHEKVASICKQLGEKENAIYHSLGANNYEKSAQLIIESADKMLRLGRLETLEKNLKKLPEDIYKKYPSLYIYQGDIYRFTSDFDRALSVYKKAKYIFTEKDKTLKLSNVLQKIAMIYLDTVQPVEADQYLKEALQIRNRKHSWEEASLLKMIAENKANEGHLIEAERLQEKARKIDKSKIKDNNLKARVQLRTGRLNKGQATLEKKMNREQDHNRIPRSHRETILILSLIHSFKGESEIARKYACEGVKLSQQFHSPFIEAVSYMRLGHAYQLPENQNYKKARNSYFKALKLVDDLNIMRGRAEPLWGLSLLEAFNGRKVLGLKYGQEGKEIAKKSGDIWLAGLLKISLGINNYFADQLADAEEVFLQAVDSFKEANDQFALTVTKMWLLIIIYRQQDWSRFKSMSEELFTIIDKRDYDFLLLKPTLFGLRDPHRLAPLLLKLRQLNIDPDIDRFVAYLELGDIDNHPGYSLRIKCLGKIKLWRGQEEIEAEDWQRAKAKKLLKLLLVYRKDYIPKEKICYYLWPDKSRKKAARNFKVVLNSLNKVLEPNRKPRQPSYFITRQGSGYGLIKNRKSCYLDVSKFEELIKRGKQAEEIQEKINYFHQAVNIYQGDFLANSLYLDWVREERERIRSMFLKTADILIEFFYKQQEYDKCILTANKILKIDNCWERAYLYKMQCFYRQNRRSQAIKVYKKCKQKLDRELNVTPIAKIERFYKKLLR